jgi:hypothetical protein
MVFQQAIPAYSAEGDSLSIDISVAKKIDVALAVGPTGVDYSTFEKDIREALSKMPNPIPDEDLYISAASSIEVNTESSFSWWTYDHASSNGLRIADDGTHEYIELDGSTYAGHPYNDYDSHMKSSDSGATMDFYGYSMNGYKDFRYLPNEQSTKKAFEFSVEEDLAYDALDGIGFFFNLDIEGSYASKNQKMNGYLLFMQYSGSGRGEKMVLYKLKDVNSHDFHHASSSTLMASYPGLTKIAESSVYSSGDKYRKIKVEAQPSKVKVWYKGSASDEVVLDEAIEENAEPVEWSATGSAEGDQKNASVKVVALDSSYISSYGFGPLGAYRTHSCALPTHLAMQKLSMRMEKVRTLPEVVREPNWHENTNKLLINLNEDKVEDFSSTSITAELLARLASDDIYYVGWASDVNAQDSEEFLAKHNLKGAVVNIDEDETDEYQEQINAIAEEIYKRYWGKREGDAVLVTDNVTLKVNGEQDADASDLEYPDGKWKIIHAIPEDMDNPEGIHPLSGAYMEDLDFSFSLPGEYTVYYKDSPVKTIYAHRAPVAAFNVAFTGVDEADFINESYDPDDMEYIANNPESSSYSWIDLDDPMMASPVAGLPEKLEKDHTYLVTLTVTDEYGISATAARQVQLPDADKADDSSLLYAYFTLAPMAPAAIVKNSGSQEIALQNLSYHLAGGDFISKFTVEKDGIPFQGLSIDEKVFDEQLIDVSSLPPGVYRITLILTSDKGESIPFSRFFTVVEDDIAPTAEVSQAPQSFTQNTLITLTFADSGGSGFKNQTIAMSTSKEPPESGWSILSEKTLRTAAINRGDSVYIHYKAWDNAGNEASGFFGPYSLEKKESSVEILSTSPESGGIVYGDGGKITVEAQVKAEGPLDSGVRVYFYHEGDLVGSAPVEFLDGKNIASFSFEPGFAGDSTIRAVFSGDSLNKGSEGETAYIVERSDEASIYIGKQTDREYDSTPYEASDISASKASSFKIEYEGRDGTAYGPSETPPSKAGKYSVIATTTDSNYKEKSAREDFEIFPRELSLMLKAENLTKKASQNNPPDLAEEPDDAESQGPADGEAGEESPPSDGELSEDEDSNAQQTEKHEAFDDILLTVEIGNVVEGETLTGTVTFLVDGEEVDSGVAIERGLNGEYFASTDAWKASGGEHELRAVYVPSMEDDYTAGIGEDNGSISGFSVDKIDQDGFSFIIGGKKTDKLYKIYGDVPFAIDFASGGQSGSAVKYEVISGHDVISIDEFGQATVLNAGAAIIEAINPGNEYYNPTTAILAVIVSKKDNLLTLTIEDNGIYQFGRPIGISVYENESGGVISYTYEGKNGTQYGPSKEPPTAVGSYYVTAASAETVNYKSAEATSDFEITACGCEINSIDFKNSLIEIPFDFSQRIWELNAFVDSFTSCGVHEGLFSYSYEIEGQVPGVSISGNILYIDDQAEGSMIRVKATALHVPTGVTASKTSEFSIIKQVSPIEESYNKNTGGSFSVDAKSPVKEIYLNGRILVEGKDFEMNASGVPELYKEFMDSLKPGENELIAMLDDGSSQKIFVNIASGNIYESREIAAGLPDIQTPDIKDIVVNDDDREAVSEGYDVSINLKVGKLREDGQPDARLIQSRLNGRETGILMDLSLIKTISNKSPEYLKDVPEKIKIKVALPRDLQGFSKYWVAMVHSRSTGLSYEIQDAKIVDGGARLQFETDKFSTVAILFQRNGANASQATGSGTSEYSPSPSGTPGSVDSGGEKDPDYDKDDGADNTASGQGLTAVIEKSNGLPYYIKGSRDIFIGFSNPIQDMMKYLKPAEAGEVFFKPNEKIFYDASESWALKEIEFTTQREVLLGTGANIFSPKDAFTRGMYAAILPRLSHASLDGEKESRFTDVQPDDWHSASISWAANQGLVSGYADGSYRPDLGIARQELASALKRYAEHMHPGSTKIEGILEYSDSSEISAWAKDGVLYCQAKGIVKGRGDGSFDPNSLVTREESASIVRRFIEVIVLEAAVKTSR